MLIWIRNLHQLRFSELMQIYMEGNMENGAQSYPNEPVPVQIALAEQDFYAYLSESFFQTQSAVYAVWQVGGRYVSALRLEPYEDGMLLEALETLPTERKKGYAKALISAVLAQMEGECVYSHVSKTNVPSLRTHEACGFRRIREYAVYIDGSVTNRSCTFVFRQTGKSC